MTTKCLVSDPRLLSLPRQSASIEVLFSERRSISADSFQKQDPDERAANDSLTNVRLGNDGRSEGVRSFIRSFIHIHSFIRQMASVNAMV